MVRDGLLFSIAVSVALAACKQGGWATSYLWGAFLSLFSMISLMVVTPRLLSPKAPQMATFILMLLLFLKLPFYGGCLYFAISAPGFSAFALLAGATLVPALIGLDALKTLVPERHVQTKPMQEAVSADLKHSMQRLQQLKAELSGERG